MKTVPLRECRVKFRDPTEKMSDKAFLLIDHLGNQCKYSAKTPSLAQAWVDRIRLVVEQQDYQFKKEVGVCVVSELASYVIDLIPVIPV